MLTEYILAGYTCINYINTLTTNQLFTHAGDNIQDEGDALALRPISSSNATTIQITRGMYFIHTTRYCIAVVFY